MIVAYSSHVPAEVPEDFVWAEQKRIEFTPNLMALGTGECDPPLPKLLKPRVPRPKKELSPEKALERLRGDGSQFSFLPLFFPEETKRLETLVEENKKRAVKIQRNRESIAARKEEAARLLAEGKSITEAAKGSRAQVNQVYAWIKKDPNIDIRKSDIFREHLMDRLADGAKREHLFKEYRISSNEWQKMLQDETEHRLLRQLPAMAEMKVILPSNYRYPHDIPTMEGRPDRTDLEVPDLRGKRCESLLGF